MAEAPIRDAKPRRLWPWLAGVPAGLILLIALGLMAQSAAVALLNTTIISYKGYQTHYDVWTRTVYISGHLGPGFPSQLSREMTWRWVDRIEIDGPSADPDEALAAARAIMARGGLTVTAREACVPGCLAILLAGERRFAQYDLTFDLADSSEFDAARGGGPQLRRFLFERRVPSAYFVPTATVDGAGAHPVSAPELLRAGLLTGLVDEAGRPISLKDAEARLAKAP